MKKNKAFTLPEILISIGILAVILGAVIGVVNNGERQRREFLGIYNMLVPKLTDMAGYATTLADRPESSGSTWWADSGSLRGLDCEEGTPSYCLREAFIEVARMMRPADRPDDDGFADDGQVNQVLSIIFNQHNRASVSDMSFAEMNEGATLGFLYTDSDCNTILTGRNGEKIRSCGVIVVDVNGKTPPNRMFVPAAQDEPPTNPNLAYDRYIVALTPTSVEQTELINQAANCAQGTVFSNGACVEERACPLSQTVLDYSTELMRANNERSITRYFPLGEDVQTCFSARCRDGLRPNAENKCNPICDPLDNGEGQQPTPTELSGGLFITEGGILDPLESNVKECCVPISTAAQFNNIRNNPNRTYCLVSDITLTENWTPIPSFTGKLYGNGHIISNISIISDANKSSARGLFAEIKNGKIEDLELDINYQDTNGSALKAKNWSVGGLSANITNSEINNVVTRGTITSEGKTGTTSTANPFYYSGVIGKSDASSQLSNIINKVNISITKDVAGKGIEYIGGIVGNGANAQFVINDGTINSTSWGTSLYQGGISGNTTSVNQAINNSPINVINVSNNYTVFDIFTGGIVGRSTNNVANVINNDTINVSSSSERFNFYLGGIGGELATGKFTNFLSQTTPQEPSMKNKSYIARIVGKPKTENNTTPAPAIRNMPPQFSLGWAQMISQENSFIKENEVGMWAYIVPEEVKDGEYQINQTNALALRWQCRSYRSGENGLNCCMPEYATWETEIPICQAHPN